MKQEKSESTYNVVGTNGDRNNGVSYKREKIEVKLWMAFRFEEWSTSFF